MNEVTLQYHCKITDRSRASRIRVFHWQFSDFHVLILHCFMCCLNWVQFSGYSLHNLSKCQQCHSKKSMMTYRWTTVSCRERIFTEIISVLYPKVLHNMSMKFHTLEWTYLKFVCWSSSLFDGFREHKDIDIIASMILLWCTGHVLWNFTRFSLHLFLRRRSHLNYLKIYQIEWICLSEKMHTYIDH